MKAKKDKSILEEVLSLQRDIEDALRELQPNHALDDFNKEYNLDIENNQIDCLDLDLKNIDNNGLIALGRIGFENLKELYLSNNKILNLKGLEGFNFELLEILDFSDNEITDINNLKEMTFKNLKTFNISKNKISDIKVLQHVNLEKLENLDLSYNEIPDINILEKGNFKNIKNLDFFDNNISNIILEKKENFEKLEELNLGLNNISDIDFLKKINFNELKVLSLQINKISNLKIFEKLNFPKLEELNLCENNINEEENEKIISKLKDKIKKFKIDHDKDSYSYSDMQIGMLLDLSNNNLKELLSFNGEQKFLNKIFCELSGKIMTLINGKHDMPYFDLNELLISSTKYLKNYFSQNKYELKNKKKLFDEFMQTKIMNKMNKTIANFVDFNTINNNYLELKKLISKNYSSGDINFFEFLDRYISKPISLNTSIEKILDNIGGKKIKNKYIIIISEGKTKLYPNEIKSIQRIARINKIMIIIIFLSKKQYIKKVIQKDCPHYYDCNLNYLFDISSKVNYKNPFAHYYIKKNWSFPEGGEGKLFFELNLKELNQFHKDLNEIKYEEVDINFRNFNSENFIHFKFNFLPKNQIFGTCWANSYSAAISLTNKRILGRKIKPFELYRENLIKFGSDLNTDGGDIESEKVKQFFKDNRIHFEINNEQEAKKALMKGRFIVFSFSLNEKQWDNFSNFFTSNNTGILSEDILNKDCKLEEEPYGGHSVLLIEVKEKYLRFLNSWGSNWGDGGTFKLKKPSILKPYGTTKYPKFYDIFFYENELSPEEKKFYSKNIGTIHEILNDFGEASISKIREHIKSLPKEFKFKCKRCMKEWKITKSEPFFYNYSPHFYLNTFEVKVELDKKDCLYKIYCPFCKNPIEIDGSLRELLLFLNLLYDGNEDFDFDFQEKYYINVNRVELHNNFKENIENESDKCSIGSENHKERKIDPLFKKEIKGIICLENNLFAACSIKKIELFELKNNRIHNVCSINNNSEFLALYYFKIENINYIAVGEKALKIFIYEDNDLIQKFYFNINTDIYQIIGFNDKNEESKKKGDGEKISRLAICDKHGYIGIYNIYHDEKEIKFDFKYKCHESSINCIIYIPEEKYLVSSSSEEKKLIFWEICQQKKKLIQIKSFNNIYSTIYNDNLLNIKNDLLVGEKDCIGVIHHEKNVEMYYYSYNGNDNEFGAVYSIKYLGDNYFICGRSFGYCSIFLLRNKTIRNINIFRNNNLSIFGNGLDIGNDKFFITHICVSKTSKNNEINKGYILVSSEDKTLKIYSYEFIENNYKPINYKIIINN